MDKKYQIFVSSTFRDLKSERLLIAKSILDLGHIPAAMEYFPAIDEEQLQYIKRVIDQCDYYILVLAGKYGSQDKRGVSYTELEYEYALSKNKFVLGFPYHDISKLPREATEDDPKTITKLKNFREKLMKARLVRPWEDDRDLDNKVTKALAVAFNEFPQNGWVRTPENSNEDLLSDLNNLRKENEKLRTEVKNLNSKTQPMIENLADLDDETSTKIDLLYGNGTPYRTFGLKCSWRYIFNLFSTSIKLAQNPQQVRQQFAINISEDNPQIMKEKESYMRVSISDIEYNKIIVQFIALGLVKETTNKSHALTDSGNSTYISSIAAIKK
ncbi:DUF4062 domain-containing protein [Methylobacterium brachiatum]|uniref:DUF4062 domain-containing protein n=1 Tax=Methylobacterium brachiatum TaxID=269660 RepID=A0ABV1R454_9HYPH